jgi:hypothetical protein
MTEEVSSGINPRAVQAFLAQPRDDWSWLKRVSKAELISELASLRPAPDTSNMMQQQLVGMLIGIATKQFCYWFGPGSGKTLLILRLLDYFRRTGEFRKGLVLVPSVEAVYSWQDQMAEWKSPLRPIPLGANSSADKALEWLSNDEGLLLAAYPSFCAMVTRRTDVIKRGKPTGERRMQPVRRSIEALCNGLDAIVFDESTEISNHASLQWRVCKVAAENVPIRFALAGRPFGKDPQTQWAQQYIIDKGESLGPTLGLLRGAMFVGKKPYWGSKYSADWTLRKEHKETFRRFAGHRSLTYETEECVELPELVKIPVRLPFPPETLEYYERIKIHLIQNHTDRKTVENDFLRMRQLGSGFLGIANDQYGAKAKITFDMNPKINAMMDVISQFPETTKFIIPFEFTFSGEQICSRLRKHKVSHVLMSGTVKNREANYRKFRTDPKCRALVMQWQVGAYALNLQMATVMIVYESPVGAIPRDQLLRRFWRAGQKKRCILYDLIMVGGIEERILQFHKEGDSIYNELSRSPGSVLK